MPAPLDVDWTQVAREYRDGEDGPALAEKYDASPRTIYRHLERLGVERRQGSVPKEARERVEKMRQLLEQGLSYQAVADELGLTRKHVTSMNAQSIGVNYYEAFERRVEREGLPTNLDVDDAFGYWFSGLFDGEGSFIARTRHRDSSRRVSFGIKIALRDDDASCLARVHSTLGIGNLRHVDKHGAANPQVWLTATRVSELLETVMPLFDQHQLRTKKRSEYAHWRKGVVRLYKKTRGGAPGPRGGWSDADWAFFSGVKTQIQRVRRYE